MGSLDRISSVLRSNVNTLLHEAAEPEHVLDALLHEMKDGLSEARVQVMASTATGKQLERDRDRNVALAGAWDRKALTAMKRGAKRLAYESLRRKVDYHRNADVYSAQLLAQSIVLGKLSRDTQLLEAKLDGMTRGRAALVALHMGGRVGGLSAQIAVVEALGGAGDARLTALRIKARAERVDERGRWADDGGRLTTQPR